MKKLLTLLFIFTAVFFLSNEKTASAQCDSVVFNYVKDSIQSWTVPANTDSIVVEMWGAGGGSGYMYSTYSYCGGSGAYLQGSLSGAALAGQTLTLYVPQGGGYSNSGPSGGIGGWPGGGTGGNDYYYSEYGGGGGGYAAISIAGNYYAIAGAGGAGGSTQYGGTAYGGGGGATNGGNGVSSWGTAGMGGTLSSGGAGGTGYSVYGSPGSYLTGGAGQPTSPNYDYGGGGGGAGYNGGGGGGDQGNSGGGGASYPGSAVTIAGITFTPTLNLPGTMNSKTSGSAIAPGPHQPGIGAGNLNAAGGNGEIVIYFYMAAGHVISNVPCYSDTTGGSAYVTVSGGTAPYTYSWQGGQTTDTISGLTGGVYTVGVTDNSGCTATAAVAITQPTMLVASAKQYSYIACYGDATGHAFVTASGGTTPYTYLWSAGGQTSDSASGMSAGVYTVRVTDPCMDTAITTVTITQPAQVLVGASQTGNILCHYGRGAVAQAVAIGGRGAYTYSWNTGGTYDTIAGLKAVTYSVKVSDSSGCMDSTDVIITQPAAIVVTSVVTSDTGGCNGSVMMNVTGGTPPYNYLWSDGSSGDSLVGECPGTYCCTVTDNNGCVNYNCGTVISTVGVQNISSNASSIKVYPDPNEGSFTLSGVKHGEVVQIYNYMGQMVTSAVVNNGTTMNFDITSQVNGIYLVRILDEHSALISEKKIIKMQ